jgi:hypothetical protein
LADCTGHGFADGLDVFERDGEAQGGEALEQADEQVLEFQPG